ncbi:hypothetical protein [Bacillus sp. B-jedd]|uniref:hypothetical protein n=1 Tax=Bacillus sp. B-jedd TaxID=1476857 RepID=UPI0005155FD1|nr:hypothetical protein [Bacillus sp. B-jedd]CEG26629.1 hypothetical protein BN1002_01479 [Bacillus sp. B-jedd]
MIRKVHLFVLELLFTSLLIYPNFPRIEMREGVFAVLAVLVFFYFIFAWLLVRSRTNAKAIYLLLVLPSLIAVAIFFNFHPLLAVLAGLFIFWRGLAVVDEGMDDRDLRMAALSMLVAMPGVISASVKESGVLKITILLLALEIALVLLGRFVYNLSELRENKSQKAGFIFYFGKIIGVLFLAGLILTLLLDYFKAAFFFIVKNGAMLFGMLVSPLFKWLEGKMQGMPMEGMFRESGMDMGQGTHEAYQPGQYSPQTDTFLLALAFIAAMIVFVYLYKKKLFIKTEQQSNTSAQLISFTGGLSTRSRMRKILPPENKLRLEFYQLETFANKKGYGRFPYETLDEWWTRIGINKDRQLIDIYGRIRYGSMPVEDKSLDYARAAIKDIKEQIKAFGKKEKSPKTMD